jgi:hypothetical protein
MDTWAECIAALAATDAKLSEFTQAIGLMTTIKGSMVMRPDDPIGMAQEVAAYVALLEKVAEAGRAIMSYEVTGGPSFPQWDKYFDDLRAALDAAKEG